MYDALEARLHDVFWEAEGQAAELVLLEQFLEKHPGTALEIGCGSGRLMFPLLEKGYLVEGLDNSRAMLEMCRATCAPHEPVLHPADMANFQTGSTYSAIAIPAFTLQFLPPAHLADVFSNIRSHLHPGGGLYITTFIPWAEITGGLEEDTWLPDHETTLPDGNTARCLTRFRIGRMSQRLTREHRYEIADAAGRTLESSTSTHRLHWFWPNELTRMLVRAGFALDWTAGDFEAGVPCGEDSQILTHCCVRADA